MKRSTLPGSGRRLATKGAAAVLATATAATVAGMAATPAQSAIGPECPETFPVSELEADDAVEGLTVIKGTEPGQFTGHVLGVLDDGIMPGLDMILVRLGSDGSDSATDQRIHDVGVWSGMSGSPVYAEDGRLIGAVSYGLSWGPSTVAGVTPAAEMRDLIDAGVDAAARTPHKVAVPEHLQERVVETGAATEAAVEGGLRQLRLPFGLSGLSEKRFQQVKKELDIPGVRMVRTGAAASTLGASDLVAGGNLAAAISYGDVSYAGIGTATMVCGKEVVGFGHPMMWDGPTGLSLHPADAIYIQEDPLGAGFKVANLGAPVGTIDQDRMAGISGFVGTRPRVGTITSHVTSETRERTGQSFVNRPEWMPDVALSHVLSNEDRIFDGVSQGSGSVSYVVQGRRGDGRPFAVTRSDVFASERDLTWETVWDLYLALWQLESNRTEDLTITSVQTDSDLSHDLVVSSIEKVSMKRGGTWVPMGRRLVLQAGETAMFKVKLVTTGGGTSSVKVAMPIRKKDAGRRGSFEIHGGNSDWNWFGGRNVGVDKLLDQIEDAPQNDDVIADLRLWRERRSQRNVNREEQVSTGVPVNGSDGARVRIVG